jgi:hypothetical protein
MKAYVSPGYNIYFAEKTFIYADLFPFGSR